MFVGLIQCSDLSIAEKAARTCTNTEHLMGTAEGFLENKIVATGHHSVLEHVFMTFSIENVSRSLLQEVARHRIASLSVQSSRYALKKLLKKELTPIIPENADFFERKIIKEVFDFCLQKLLELQILGSKNDIIKYVLPESFPTCFVWTMNLRSFINVYQLRTDKSALLEFQVLANEMFNILPDNIKSIVKSAY